MAAPAAPRTERSLAQAWEAAPEAWAAVALVVSAAFAVGASVALIEAQCRRLLPKGLMAVAQAAAWGQRAQLCSRRRRRRLWNRCLGLGLGSL